MNPFRRISIAFGALATAAFLAVASHSVQAQRYDFQWYSGAAQTWVYEAAPKLLLDVYDDPSTPEEDVYFRIWNTIATELSYLSTISDLQIDTGTATPSMFKSLSVWNYSGYVRFFTYAPGAIPGLLDDGARLSFTGNYAVGKGASGPKPDGVNPGEYVVLKAVLADGVHYSDVVAALDVGLSSRYVEGPYNSWTAENKQTYRAGAPQGLRFTLLVHSIVPNTWNPDGHGLFMTHRRVDNDLNIAPSVTATAAAGRAIAVHDSPAAMGAEALRSAAVVLVVAPAWTDGAVLPDPQLVAAEIVQLGGARPRLVVADLTSVRVGAETWPADLVVAGTDPARVGLVTEFVLAARAARALPDAAAIAKRRGLPHEAERWEIAVIAD